MVVADNSNLFGVGVAVVAAAVAIVAAVTAYEQNNQKGIAVVFTTILLVIPFLISGLQLNLKNTSENSMGQEQLLYDYCC